MRGNLFSLWWFKAWILAMLGAAVVVLSVALVIERGQQQALAEREVASYTAPPLEATRTHVAFLGDSYTEASQVKQAESFVYLLGQQYGWATANDGSGGTGYVNPGPQGSGRYSLPNRVKQVVGQDPAIVFVSAGINDAGRNYSDGQLTKAIDLTLDGLQDGLPKARIVVIGPWWPNGFPTADAKRIDGLTKVAADERGLDFIDPIADRWITGSNDGTVAGNRSRYIGPDGTHPNAAGQAYLADKIAAALTTIGIKPEATPAPTPSSTS